MTRYSGVMLRRFRDAIQAVARNRRVPADEVARTTEIAEEIRSRVNAQIPASEQFSTAKEFADHLVNVRRRGATKGGLPKIRGGHGPGGRQST